MGRVVVCCGTLEADLEPELIFVPHLDQAIRNGILATPEVRMLYQGEQMSCKIFDVTMHWFCP